MKKPEIKKQEKESSRPKDRELGKINFNIP